MEKIIEEKIVGSNGKCGENLTWTLDDNGTLTISGTGAMTNYIASFYGPWYSSRNIIKEVRLGNNVTTIGNYAFYGCTSLVDITIPDSVTSIGEEAFNSCTSLTSVTIGKSVTSIGRSAFYCCVKLESITIPNSVTNINQQAFGRCDELQSITMSNCITTIGQQAFDSCKSLTRVNITDIAAWCNISFGNATSNPLYYAKEFYVNNNLVTNLVIPDGVTSIGSYMFGHYIGLISVTIPDSVMSIGVSAFSYCENLTSVTIGNSVTSIGSHAFNYCTKLTNVAIGNSVTTIGENAFNSCRNLETIIIPDSITSIGNQAFVNCRKLKSIEFSKNLRTIGENILLNCMELEEIIVDAENPDYSSQDGNLYNKHKTTLLQYAVGKTNTYFTIPNSVETIGSSAFQYGSNIKSITIPDSVTSIGSSAFYNCTSLTSVTIPDSVTSIGDSVFAHCTSLTSVIIGNNVTTIKTWMFYDCSSLKSITIPNSVETIARQAFLYSNNLQTIIFEGTENEWKQIKIDTTNSELNNATIIYLIVTRVISNGQMTLELTNIEQQLYKLNSYVGTDTELIIPNDITAISSEAFVQVTTLEKIQIHKNLMNIQDKAFYNCVNLSNIIVDENNLYYSSNNGILYDKAQKSLLQYAIGKQEKTFKIPDDVQHIGSYAFANSSNLTEIDIPNSVRSIEMGAFEACVNLKDITIPNNVQKIQEYTFYNCTNLFEITMSDGITSIGSYATTNCENLTNINFWGNYTQKDALLEQLSLSQGNENMIQANWICGILSGDWRYVVNEDNTASLISYQGLYQEGDIKVTIPEQIDNQYIVTKIKSGAFVDTQNQITCISISSNIIELDYQVFMGTEFLQEIEVDRNNENFDTVDGILFNKKLTELIYCPQQIPKLTYTIPLQVEIIKEGAFYSNCNISQCSFEQATNLNTIETKAFADSQIESLSLKTDWKYGEGVFQDCTKLLTVEFTEDLQSVEINNSLFANCTKLQTVTLPDNITSIKYNAFYNCPQLNAIKLHNISRIEQGAFALPQAIQCNSWEFINLQSSVIVDEGAFRGREGKIGTVYFGGTDSQFDKTVQDTVIVNSNKIIFNGVKTEEWEIQKNVLTRCSKAGTELQIPQDILDVSIIKIGSQCFSENNTYQTVKLQDNIVEIGERAFEGCVELTQVFLGNKITSIGDYAFANCQKLISIKMPDSLERIGAEAFYNSTNLSTIELNDNLTFIGAQAFFGTDYYNTKTNWTNGLLIMQGNKARYLIEINSDCLSNEDKEINLEDYTFDIMASGCIDNKTQTFLTGLQIIKLPYKLKRINTGAINLQLNNVIN